MTQAVPRSDIPKRSPARKVDAPFFIVGSPRSGTTLLRLMLDGHPRLAIPHESHFIVGLRPRRVPRGRAPNVEDVLAHHWFPEWFMDADLVRARVGKDEPTDYAELIDSVFTAYAEMHGKARWGDKTPGYVHHTAFLRRLFPHARFIHIIRDGREVAASLAQQPWGPRSPVSGAMWWRNKVRDGRRAGRRSPDAYHEVRLEGLIEDPSGVLKEVCAFIGEDYDPIMLDYPARLPFDPRAAGFEVEHLSKPPTPGLRDWRAGLRPREQAGIEAVCRPLLRELGYATGPRYTFGSLYAWIVRIGALARDAPRAMRTRVEPRTRDF